MTAVSDVKGLLQEVCQGGFVSIYEKGRFTLFLSDMSYCFHSPVFNHSLIVVKDVKILSPQNPEVQCDHTFTGETGSAAPMESPISKSVHICL